MLTPFMGVGSEVYAALLAKRQAIGIEIKPSYYRQAVANVRRAVSDAVSVQAELALFDAEAEAQTEGAAS
jgi:tRNA G10  N-methylase Trm11